MMVLETKNYKIKDIDLADFGRKEIEIAEKEMPGLIAVRERYAPQNPLAEARIMGSSVTLSLCHFVPLPLCAL